MTLLSAIIPAGDVLANRPAFGVPGRLYYATDTDTLYRDTGSAWETWTMGAGGSVATDAIWDAAGDLAVGSGANTAAKLTKGSDGDVLTVTAGAVGWAAPAGGGGSGAVTKITETILGSAAATISLTSISGSYRNLRLTLTGRCTAAITAATVQIRFNGDTAANYDWQQLASHSAGIPVSMSLGATSIELGYISGASAPANTPGTAEFVVFDYARTVWDKQVQSRTALKQGTSGASQLWLKDTIGWWRSTVAVTQIDILTPDGTTFAAGTVVTLWGEV